MTKISPNMQRAVRLAIAGVAAAAAGSGAFAQTASVANTGLEEIIVTGSRIQQSPNSVSVAPIATITSEDIKKTGLVRVEDLLNNMPQVIAENGSGQSISSDGTATVSLRHDDLMSATLAPGVRHTSYASAVDAIFGPHGLMK